VPSGYVLQTLEQTHEFGARLASILRPGDLIVLTGPLGAGKTALVQGIGAGLGVTGAITSPTFVIARVHRPFGGTAAARIPLVHVDAYRLCSIDEIDDLDLDVDMSDAVTAVEWGAGLAEQLADSHLLIELSRDDASEVRTATLTPSGGGWAERLRELG